MSLQAKKNPKNSNLNLISDSESVDNVSQCNNFTPYIIPESYKGNIQEYKYHDSLPPYNDTKRKKIDNMLKNINSNKVLAVMSELCKYYNANNKKNFFDLEWFVNAFNYAVKEYSPEKIKNPSEGSIKSIFKILKRIYQVASQLRGACYGSFLQELLQNNIEGKIHNTYKRIAHCYYNRLSQECKNKKPNMFRIAKLFLATKEYFLACDQGVNLYFSDFLSLEERNNLFQEVFNIINNPKIIASLSDSHAIEALKICRERSIIVQRNRKCNIPIIKNNIEKKLFIKCKKVFNRHRIPFFNRPSKKLNLANIGKRRDFLSAVAYKVKNTADYNQNLTNSSYSNNKTTGKQYLNNNHIFFNPSPYNHNRGNQYKNKAKTSNELDFWMGDNNPSN